MKRNCDQKDERSNKICTQKKDRLKKLLLQKIFGQNFFFVKNMLSKIFFGSLKIVLWKRLVANKFGSKIIWVQTKKILWVHINFCLRKCQPRKNLGSKNDFFPEKYWSKYIFWSKKKEKVKKKQLGNRYWSSTNFMQICLGISRET